MQMSLMLRDCHCSFLLIYHISTQALLFKVDEEVQAICYTLSQQHLSDHVQHIASIGYTPKLLIDGARKQFCFYVRILYSGTRQCKWCMKLHILSCTHGYKCGHMTYENSYPDTLTATPIQKASFELLRMLRLK